MRSRLTLVTLSAVSLLLLTVSASPQSQTPAGTADTTQQKTPVIHVTTRLLQVSVIVQDKEGAPMTGLRKEDFRVLDGGKPQEIAFFSATAPGHAPAHPLPASVFTNRSDLKGEDPGATIVLLFDCLNTSFEDQGYARWNVLHFLKSVKPQDHVAIFALTTELISLHDFTQDTAALASSVNRFSPRLLAAFDASNPKVFQVPGLDNDPFFKSFEDHVNNANGKIADWAVVDRFRITSAAFVALADYVADIPGRKSLVWISGGIPIQLGAGRIGVPDRDDFRFDKPNVPSAAGAGDMSVLARVLNRVNMAIYPIDAHGVEAGAFIGFFTRQDRRDTFRLLADRTGGRAFYGTNDIAGAINSAFEDGRYTYTIGFYPNHGVWDGEFREIKISVPAEDAHLRYRQGYFAFPERSEGAAIMRTDLQEAARSPLDATGLGVSVKGQTVPPASAHLVKLQVTLDPKQFLLRDEGDQSRGSMDLLFLQKDSSGQFLFVKKQHLDVSFDRKEYSLVAENGLTLQQRLIIDPASAELRVLVRDAGSGALGSVTISVKELLK